MKNKILNLIIILLFVNCNSQTIKSIYNDGILYDENIYYKDTNNDMNKFTGTWVYENGTTKITLVLQKRLQVHISHPYNCFVDEIIGGYKYEINGVTIINTIPDIDNNKLHYQNTISGSLIIKNSDNPLCQNCPPNDKRLKLRCFDPLAPYINTKIVLRYFTEFDQENFEVKIYEEESILPENATIIESRLPLGNYIFEKQ